MKRIVMWVVLAVVLAAAAALYYAFRLVQPWPTTDQVTRAENALAGPGLIGLGHLHVEQATALERLVLGQPNQEISPEQGEEEQRDLLALLRTHGIDPREVVHQWIVGGIVDEQGSGLVQILYGDFPVEALRAALEQAYDVSPGPTQHGYSILTMTRLDMDTCERSAPIAVSLGRERVVFGEPKLVQQVLERLRSGASPEIDLGAWRAFREAHVASTGILLPEAAGQLVSNPLLRMVAEGALEQVSPAHALFLGARPQLLPPGVLLRTRVEAQDERWVLEQERRFAAWQTDVEARGSERMKGAASLLRRISVSASGRSLTFQIALDTRVREELERLMNDMGQLLFGGLGGGAFAAGLDQDGGKPQEVTVAERELQKYISPFSADQLPALEREDSQQLEGEVRSGPFGIWRQAVRVLPELGDLVEIELAAESSRIPNLGSETTFSGETPRLRLFVSRVVGRAGEDLLRAEQCGQHRNALGGTFQSGFSREYVDGKWVTLAPTYSGTKKVRLGEGVQLDEVDAVEGYIELNLPTTVQTVRVDAPFTGKVIEGDGVRIEFEESEPGTVSYGISGRSDRMLALRGRNRAGKALQSGSTSSMGQLFRPGKRVSKSFEGEVASVDVILVEKESRSRYPFVLEDLAPHFPAWTGDPSNVVVAQKRSAFLKEVGSSEFGTSCPTGATAGDSVQPFQLCLHSADMLWGGHINTSFEVFSPYSRSITENLSALELAVDGVWLEGPAGEGTVPERVATSGRDFVYLERGFQKDHLEDQLWLDAETEEEPTGDRLTHVDGRLIHRLPLELFPLRLDITKLGNEIEYSNGFAMKLVEIGRDSMRVRIRGDRAHIVQLVVRDRQDKPMITAAQPIEPVPAEGEGAAAATDEWLASFRLSSHEAGAPKSLEVVYALAVDERTYPFHLAVPQ